jgi:hypothetical protein
MYGMPSRAWLVARINTNGQSYIRFPLFYITLVNHVGAIQSIHSSLDRHFQNSTMAAEWPPYRAGDSNVNENNATVAAGTYLAIFLDRVAHNHVRCIEEF